MTSLTKQESRVEDIRDRIAQRDAVRAAYIKRMADYAKAWAENPRTDYWQLRFLDALGFCIDSDLSDEMDTLRHDLRIDAEGYPIDDEGDTKLGADRRYMPLPKLERTA